MPRDEFQILIHKDGSASIQVPLELLEAASTPLMNDRGLVRIPVPEGRMSAALAGIRRHGRSTTGGGRAVEAIAAGGDSRSEVVGRDDADAPTPRALKPKSVAPTTAARRYMKKKDFAFRHAVSLSTLNYWIRCGLPTNGIKGRGIRIKVEEGDAWVEAGGPALAGKGRR